ncbi:MAG: hypothetical protein KF812_05850 [Fimbriimonadaceae bacterium]|nr:hypothetical protein [Fimbriimonadaceae bacterium]
MVDTTPGTATVVSHIFGTTDARESDFLIEEFERRFALESLNRVIVNAQKAEGMAPESLGAIRSVCERHGVVPFLLLGAEGGGLSLAQSA